MEGLQEYVDHSVKHDRCIFLGKFHTVTEDNGEAGGNNAAKIMQNYFTTCFSSQHQQTFLSLSFHLLVYFARSWFLLFIIAAHLGFL